MGIGLPVQRLADLDHALERGRREAAARDVAELVLDVAGLERVLRAAAAMQDLARVGAAITGFHLEARRMAESRAHGLDLRVHAGMDAPDEIQYPRVAQA